MKKTLLISLISLLTYAETSTAAETSAATTKSTTSALTVSDENTVVVPFKVEFALGKTKFDEKTLNTFISNMKYKEALKYIQIVTSATTTGSQKLNDKLTDQRAETLQSYLKTQFPTSQIRSVSIGKNARHGKSGLINFVFTKSLMQITATPVKETTTKNEAVAVAPEKKSAFTARAALRVGRDIYMVDRQVPYFSMGAEASLQFKKSDSFQYEIGAQGSQLVNDNYLTLYTFYGFGGAYYTTQKGIFLGGRVLMGGVTNQNHEITHDEGAELRVGYDYKTFSVGFGAGRTKNTARYGLDFGINL